MDDILSSKEKPIQLRKSQNSRMAIEVPGFMLAGLPPEVLAGAEFPIPRSGPAGSGGIWGEG
jgi:hypothetical protein